MKNFDFDKKNGFTPLFREKIAMYSGLYTHIQTL